MKRFIRYLYEYEQEKRMRNVGFVKVEQKDDECMVHIHGKGLHMSGRGSLQIYLVYMEDGECIGIWQREADNIDPAVNVSFRYTKDNVGVSENYEKIDGVVLENVNGQRYGAIWDESPVNVSRMKIWEPEQAEPVTEPGEELMEEPMEEPDMMPGRAAQSAQMEEDGEPDRVMQSWQEETLQGEKKPAQMREDLGELRESSDCPDEFLGKPEGVIDVIPILRSEEIPFSKKTDKHQPERTWKVRKIQRTEISKLARCEWRLANNNFLLHGYYNYHHLVLLNDGAQVMLGVPGIYHEKEALAAEAFGFARFIEKDKLEVNLRPEECNEEHPFGYWCREVRPAFRLSDI